MINVGLVGFGLSGRYLQAPFLEGSPYYNLVGIVTSQPIPKEFFKQAVNFKNFDELIAHPEIQMVSICSPNSTHFEYAKRALEAGKHVLVEKPATATAKQAKELYALAKKKNVVLGVFQNRRFDSDFMTLARLIKSGVLGEIHTYEAYYNRYKPNLNTKAWKEVKAEANGILYDLGSHIIDQAVFLFGKPTHIHGHEFKQREHSEIDDAFDIHLDYGKLKVHLRSSLIVKSSEPRYVVHGTLGSFRKNGIDIQEDQLKAGWLPNMAGYGEEPVEQNGLLETNLAGLEFSGEIETLAGNWDFLFQSFAAAVLEGKPFIIQEEEIISQLEIIEAVKKGA